MAKAGHGDWGRREWLFHPWQQWAQEKLDRDFVANRDAVLKETQGIESTEGAFDRLNGNEPKLSGRKRRERKRERCFSPVPVLTVFPAWGWVRSAPTGKNQGLMGRSGRITYLRSEETNIGTTGKRLLITQGDGLLLVPSQVSFNFPANGHSNSLELSYARPPCNRQGRNDGAWSLREITWSEITDS